MDGWYTNILLNTPSIHSGLTLKALDKWQAVVTTSGDYHGFDAVTGVSNVTLDGLQFTAAAVDGVKFDGPSLHDTVQNCWIHHNWHNGILATESYGNLIQNCLIEYNGLQTTNANDPNHGIYMSGTNNVIRNNVIRYHQNWGTQIYSSLNGGSPSVNCQLYNNLFYGNCDGLTVCAFGAFTNYVFGNTICYSTNYGLVANYGTIAVTNNITFGNLLGDVVQGSASAAIWQCDYNLSTASLSHAGPHDVVSLAANFVNANCGLFWLLSTAPARNAALSSCCGPVDFFGNAQSSVPDIGFVQYQANLAADTRTLDPSSSNGADYWTPPASP
jgi:hypothetical protein